MIRLCTFLDEAFWPFYWLLVHIIDMMFSFQFPPHLSLALPHASLWVLRSRCLTPFRRTILSHSSAGRSSELTIISSVRASRSHGAGGGCSSSPLFIASTTPSSHFSHKSLTVGFWPYIDLWTDKCLLVSVADGFVRTPNVSVRGFWRPV